MTELFSIDEQRIKNWSADYAAVYDEEGEDAAGIYLVSNVPTELHKDLAPYIRKELESLGWEF